MMAHGMTPVVYRCNVNEDVRHDIRLEALDADGWAIMDGRNAWARPGEWRDGRREGEAIEDVMAATRWTFDEAVAEVERHREAWGTPLPKDAK
jgi:hypothetical protein